MQASDGKGCGTMCDGLPDARLCLSGSDVSSLGLAASQGKVNGNACCFGGWSLAVGWQWPFEGSLSAGLPQAFPR